MNPNPPTNTKATATPETEQVEEWTDEQLDAMTQEFEESDVKDALALRTPAQRALLRAKDGA